KFNSDSDGWTWVFRKDKQQNSKPIDNPFFKDLGKIATSFYVSNFPDSLDAKGIWKDGHDFEDDHFDEECKSVNTAKKPLEDLDDILQSLEEDFEPLSSNNNEKSTGM
ncbi:hypothetical protein Tco_0579575, partial [Tanacetum coccineum]